MSELGIICCWGLLENVEANVYIRLAWQEEHHTDHC